MTALDKSFPCQNNFFFLILIFKIFLKDIGTGVSGKLIQMTLKTEKKNCEKHANDNIAQVKPF